MNNTEALPSSLENERKTTDNSLVAERHKTNESLLATRDKTELQTDKLVRDERSQADRDTSSSRIASDSNRDSERAHQGNKVTKEQRAADDRIAGERISSDKAMELERSKIDDAMILEREVKSELASRLLGRERKLTDKSLSAERTKTDSNVDEASGILSSEVADHLKTRTSLTTRDEFIAILSHDLRNPIGAASSCAEMLLTDVSYKTMDSEIKHWLGFIKRNVDTSLRLIADLLDMERMANGKLELNIQRNCIGKIVRESVETFVLAASAKNILLRVVPANVEGWINCDADRIQQVISNLISNAIKFTPEGGRITVNVELNEAELQISVNDTGSGVPSENKDQIFERFAQLSSNDRRGLGLGLYISKLLVEAHHGSIVVESKLGHGSSFRFNIPAGLTIFSSGTNGSIQDTEHRK